DGLGQQKRFLQKVALALLGPYRVSRIFHQECVPEFDRAPGLALRRLPDCRPDWNSDPLLLNRFSYAGANSFGFGAFVGDELVAVCWFWKRPRFNDDFLWDLKEDEAILVDLFTTPRFRGRGIAPRLIAFAAREMRVMNLRNLITWIWHSNRPSV